VTLADIAGTLAAYVRTLRVERLRERAALERLQSKWLARHLSWVTEHSAYYRAYRGKAFDDFPVIDKREWLKHFDTINTVGARRGTIEGLALEAERSRDFSANWRGTTYGLSSGTSGRRGLFLASAGERAIWAGTLLAKMFGARLLEGARIALIIRAGSGLYDSVGVLRFRFRYIDPFQPWDDVREQLRHFRPSLIVAPAQILSRLASQPDGLCPSRIISVAEVLDEFDRERIETAFGVRVEQIYQATEGFLGASCEDGAVHLNEPFLLVEREWQDAAHTRFIPILTDLWRRSQPVIRYRLDDVLRIRQAACPCGRPSAALVAIEGRQDDLLYAASPSGRIPVFSDLIRRVVLRSIDSLEDFEIVAQSDEHWTIRLAPLPPPNEQQRLVSQLSALIVGLKASPPSLRIETLMTGALPTGKRRRVRGAARPICEF